MARQHRIATVIVTYNGQKWIAECLESLKRSDVEFTIIVVDNCSTDNTVEIVERSFPGVVLIRNEKNIGFGQANNVGIRYAMTQEVELIFLLNQDTRVEPATVRSLSCSFDRNSNEFGILSPLHLTETEADLDPGFRRFLTGSLGEDIIRDIMRNPYEDVIEVDFVNAAAWMIPVAVFRNVGGFAPLFFHYGEDRDFVNRMRFHGYKIAIVPGARIVHCRGERSQVTEWPFERKVSYYFVNWLSRVANIRTSWVAGFFSGFLWAGKESFFYLIKGRPDIAAAAMRAMKRITLSLNKIRIHREAVKRRGMDLFLRSKEEE